MTEEKQVDRKPEMKSFRLSKPTRAEYLRILRFLALAAVVGGVSVLLYRTVPTGPLAMIAKTLGVLLALHSLVAAADRIPRRESPQPPSDRDEFTGK